MVTIKLSNDWTEPDCVLVKSTTGVFRLKLQVRTQSNMEIWTDALGLSLAGVILSNAAFIRLYSTSDHKAGYLMVRYGSLHMFESLNRRKDLKKELPREQ